jgi:hypothetical protein
MLKYHKSLVKRFLPPIFLFAFLVLQVDASETGRLFQSDEIIHLELRSDFGTLQKDRLDNPVYRDAELIYHLHHEKPVKLSVKIMVRGNFRLKPENCDFPPLFVNFKKEEVKNTLFENQNRLKLITPCHDDEDVVEEYIVYKMYNLVSVVSLKARLVKILYFDTVTNKKIFEKYSFFLEDKDAAAARHGMKETNRFITPFNVNADEYKKMSVFQYMIGNKDWFITSRKNIILMQPEDSTLAPYAVPYDFDFAGFVNAFYTKPRGVPDEYLADRRLYKGLCYSEKEFVEIRKYFRELRPEFVALIKSMKMLPRINRNFLISYIDHFYRLAEDMGSLRNEFLSTCETRKDYNLTE